MPDYITRIDTGEHVPTAFKVVRVAVAQPREYYERATMELDNKRRRRGIFRLFSNKNKKAMTTDSGNMRDVGATQRIVEPERVETYTNKVALQPPGQEAVVRAPVRPERRKKRAAPAPPPIEVETVVEDVPTEAVRVHPNIREYDVICDDIVDERRRLSDGSESSIIVHKSDDNVDSTKIKEIIEEQAAHIEVKQSRAELVQLQLAQNDHGEIQFDDPFTMSNEVGVHHEEDGDNHPDDVNHQSDDETDMPPPPPVVQIEHRPPCVTHVIINHEGDGTGGPMPVVVVDRLPEPPAQITDNLTYDTVSSVADDNEHVDDSTNELIGSDDNCDNSPRKLTTDDDGDAILAHFREAIADGERQLLDDYTSIPRATAVHTTHDRCIAQPDEHKVLISDDNHGEIGDPIIEPHIDDLPDQDEMSSHIVTEFEHLQSMFAEWRRQSGEYDAIVRLGARVPDERRAHLQELQKEIARQHDKVQAMCQEQARNGHTSPDTSDSGLSGTHESSYSAPPTDKQHIFQSLHTSEQLRLATTTTPMSTIVPTIKHTPVTFDNYNGRGSAKETAAIYARQTQWEDVIEGPDTTETVVKPSDLFGRRRHNDDQHRTPVVKNNASKWPPVNVTKTTDNNSNANYFKSNNSNNNNNSFTRNNNTLPQAMTNQSKPNYQFSSVVTMTMDGKQGQSAVYKTDKPAVYKPDKSSVYTPTKPTVNRFTAEYHLVADDGVSAKKEPHQYDQPQKQHVNHELRQPDARLQQPLQQQKQQEKPMKHFTSDYSLNTKYTPTTNTPKPFNINYNKQPADTGYSTHNATVYKPPSTDYSKKPAHSSPPPRWTMESSESLVPSNIPPPPPLCSTSSIPPPPPLNITPDQLVQQMSQVRLKPASSARRPHPVAESRKLPEKGRDMLMDAIRQHGGANRLKKVA